MAHISTRVSASERALVLLQIACRHTRRRPYFWTSPEASLRETLDRFAGCLPTPRCVIAPSCVRTANTANSPAGRPLSLACSTTDTFHCRRPLFRHRRRRFDRLYRPFQIQPRSWLSARVGLRPLGKRASTKQPAPRNHNRRSILSQGLLSPSQYHRPLLLLFAVAVAALLRLPRPDILTTSRLNDHHSHHQTPADGDFYVR